MMQRRVLILATCLLCAGSAWAQPDTAALLAAQRQAMQPLSAMLDGTWRGSARVFLADGKTHELTQTERVGSMLGGAVKVIEGRGYGPDGALEFNAFAVLSYATRTGKFNFHTNAQGHSGDYAFEPRPDGFVWSMRFGPVTIRHTAVVKDGTWTEVSERLMEAQPPVRMVEMTLRRIGDTDWPAAGAVPAR